MGRDETVRRSAGLNSMRLWLDVGIVPGRPMVSWHAGLSLARWRSQRVGRWLNMPLAVS